VIWKDETRYSQGERGKVDPKTWSITSGGIRVTVTRHIYHDPDAWVMHCRELNIDTFELSERDIEAAKAKALKIATQRCEHFLKILKEMK
jgi:hypothetical protein